MEEELSYIDKTVKERLKEETELLVESSKLENLISKRRSEVRNKNLELGQIQGRIELLKEQNVSKEINLKEENEILTQIKESLSR